MCESKCAEACRPSSRNLQYAVYATGYDRPMENSSTRRLLSIDLRDLLELGRRIDLQRLGQALRVNLKHLLQQRAALLGLPGG